MKKISNALVGAALVFWLAETCYAFWHFEGQYMRPVARPKGAAIASPELLPAPPLQQLTSESGQVNLTGDQPVTVLNFWNPRCPCSRYAEADVRKLIAQYEPRGVRFVTIIASGGSDEDVLKAGQAWDATGIVGTAPIVDRNNRVAMKFGVWAAPAAVILNNQSRIEYVGAYNIARYCSNPDSAWAAKALSAIVQGKRPPRAKTLFFGCQLTTNAG